MAKNLALFKGAGVYREKCEPTTPPNEEMRGSGGTKRAIYPAKVLNSCWTSLK